MYQHEIAHALHKHLSVFLSVCVCVCMYISVWYNSSHTSVTSFQSIITKCGRVASQKIIYYSCPSALVGWDGGKEGG